MTVDQPFITHVTADNLDEVIAQNERRAAESKAAARAVLDIRAVGRSDRGLVTVVVDGSALVVDLEFAQGAGAVPSALGQAVKQAHDRAVLEWRRQVHQVAEDHLPHQPDVAADMARAADAELPSHVGHDDEGDRR
jgi:DNA-binding protein YbaB